MIAIFTSVSRRLRQWACGIYGHDLMLKFDRAHIYLECCNCGHETPGFDCSKRMARTVKSQEACPSRTGDKRAAA